MLTLPASPAQVLAQVIVPAFQHLLPTKFDSTGARVPMLAIALQESSLRTRQQGHGPARGLWQFEQGGAVRGVLQHKASSTYARMVCMHQAVAPVESDVYAGLLVDDLLAAAFARLLLWTDSAPLPAVGDVHASWDYYLRNWRPGKPRPNDWAANYAKALDAINGTG